MNIITSQAKKTKEYPWNIVEEIPPPEYAMLVGRSSNGDEYPFHARRLENGAWLFVGGDLHPVADPVLWRHRIKAEQRKDPNQ